MQSEKINSQNIMKTTEKLESMSRARAAYWGALAKKMEGRVDIIDPQRLPLVELRACYAAGTRVYRASTGGKWGKSASIVTL